MTSTRTEDPLARYQEAGIIGLGGGGFPAHAKYRAGAEVVIANGAECEPLLWSDKVLMERHAAEVLEGVARVVELVGAKRGVVALKRKAHDAADALQAALRARGGSGPPLEVFLLRNIYPAGDELTLVQEVLGRTIPETALPLKVGAVVNNVATLRAIARADRHGEPLTSRYVTVTGEVRAPVVVDAPVGTSIQACLDAAGGTTGPDVAVIQGGPMMGRVVTDLAAPILKTTSGLVVLPAKHALIQRKLADPARLLRVARAACCLCAACSEVCPRNLLGHRIFPHRLMQSVSAGITNDQEAYLGTLLCCECGLCSAYGCPLYLDPARMMLEVKTRLRVAKVEYPARPEAQASGFFPIKGVPAARLVSRLQLSGYDRPVPVAAAPLLPDRVTLLTRQGAGYAAKPVVAAGARVRRGDLVAEAAGQISAAVHASVGGVVEQVTEAAVVIRREEHE
jgi:RnfABCDGE-type electron transport complex C subunit